MTVSFKRMASVVASTKRNPAMVAGKVGAAATNLTGLKVLPLMPVSDRIVVMYKLDSPRETYVTYIEGAPDVIEGDILTVAAVDYRIRGAQPWATDRAFWEIVAERIVGA